MRCLLLAPCLLLAALVQPLAGLEQALGVDGAAGASCSALPSDAEALACLSAQPPLSSALPAALEACMTRGFWRTCSHLAVLSKQRRVDLSSTATIVGGQIRRELQALSDSIVAGLKTEGIAPAYECVGAGASAHWGQGCCCCCCCCCCATCRPSLPATQQPSLTCTQHAPSSHPLSPLPPHPSPPCRWAQSPEQVFLQVKWAHKLDAPATLGCEPSAPVFAERLVTFQAECREKNKAFALTLPLFGSIDAAGCTWGNASVGRAFVTLQKASHGPWLRLLNTTARPSNQNLWWAMKEAHAEALEKWRSATPTPTPTPTPTGSAASAQPPAPPAQAAEQQPTQVPLPPLKSLH